MDYIGVFCGSSEKLKPKFYNLAYEVGAYLAKCEIIVVHGGVNLGLMRALNDGCKDHFGKSIGILPSEFLENKFEDGALTGLYFGRRYESKEKENSRPLQSLYSITRWVRIS